MAAGVGWGGLTLLRPRPGKAAASERVHVAVIGVRGRGRGLAEGFAGMSGAVVTHICDVDAGVLADVVKRTGARQSSEPKPVADIRKLLEDPSIDAIAVATPDHWHALATIWGCQHGKHVYVEKPASHNIAEGRKMIEAARKYDRVVQLGTQSRSAPHYLEVMEYLRSGKLGELHMAKVWNSQKRSNIGKKADGDAPAGVDYDLWLGPAPVRPFNVNRFHSTWHWNWDYGTGDIGNDGVHDLDIARWGLGVESPTAVTCAGGKLAYDDDQQVPDTQIVTYSFPESKAVLVYEQRLWSPYHQEGYENGVAFYGTNGYLLVGRSGWKVVGARDKPISEATGKFSDEPHRRNFLDCIKSGGRPNADIEEGHRSTVLSHLGNIAYRTGRSLTYDGKAETILHDDEAAALLRRTYRKPFAVPDRV
jgi:predicted dehydrogenase